MLVSSLFTLKEVAPKCHISLHLLMSLHKAHLSLSQIHVYIYEVLNQNNIAHTILFDYFLTLHH